MLNKEPFQHESLLVDRKEKQLSSQEKRLAKKGYEREKQAARQPAYSMASMGRGGHRPVASVRPMQQGERPSRWIPAEHWQRQGIPLPSIKLSHINNYFLSRYDGPGDDIAVGRGDSN